MEDELEFRNSHVSAGSFTSYGVSSSHPTDFNPLSRAAHLLLKTFSFRKVFTSSIISGHGEEALSVHLCAFRQYKLLSGSLR